MFVVSLEVGDEAAGSSLNSLSLFSVLSDDRLREPSLELINSFGSGFSNTLAGSGIASLVADSQEFLNGNGVALLEQVTDFLQTLESLIGVVHDQVVERV